MLKCPGQDQRFWKPEDIFEVHCPGCGQVVEFFKDEPTVKCRECGCIVANPKIDLGCAQWCRYAKQCIGVSSAQDTTAMREKLIGDMKEIFAGDRKRIDHALAVLDYAEQIQAIEGGDPLIVKAAAILHDIGIHQAEQKYGSTAGKYQEIEGPPIAKKILENYKLDGESVEHICRIIANHHSAKGIDTVEFRCVWDADWLVNIPDECSKMSKDRLKEFIGRIFKTDRGRRMAKEIYFHGD